MPNNKAVEAEISPSAVLAAEFDRDSLSEKTRVHQLAKRLGMVSKDVVVALDGIGLVKVAQSNLSKEEVEKLLDALSQPVLNAAPAAVPDVEPVEKIRRRVEKNVENEIHQIEEKVERELAAVAQPTDFEAAAREEATAELLEDIVPEITPAPVEAPVYTPIFVAPAVVPTENVQDTDDEQARERTARKRRGRRGTGRGRGAEAETVTEVSEEASTSEVEEVNEPIGIKGSTRLEAQRRRRTEMREENKKRRHVVSTQEFMERRESMERRMIVRERQRHDHPGLVTQVGVLEDDQLVEQFVTSDAQMSMVGNIYLGRVQNVLPSMEAAFIDIGKGRNGVLYAGEVDWKAAGLGGRGRRIEQALKAGDQVLVQVSKDPLGHKGARLTTQISLAGRYLVYVPGGRSAGISRKLPGPERKRLKEILGRVVPAQGGTIIRTAAEGVSEENIAADVNRLHTLWEQIKERTAEEKKSRGSKPITMYEEPDMLVKVIRDLFNEDFTSLIVDGDRAWNTVRAYIQSVAPDLVSRVEHFNRADFDGKDAFEAFDLNTQLEEALSRKVNLPSGGSLIIDRTEAMTVIDVNTGRYTGKGGGNLEETVTLNNIEAAEEIVRQMRLRDLGGMIVVDFIDMVLPENQELVLRRLNEALENDRTRHQVSEVTSLGLVQMTRKRIGAGLLETFSSPCEHCEGRGIIVHVDPVDTVDERVEAKAEERSRRHQRSNSTNKAAAEHPMVVAMRDLVESDEHDLDQEFEELAASVIVLDDSDLDDVVNDKLDEPERILAESTVEPEEGPRRRARRQRQESAADDIAVIAAAAVDIASEEDPDEPSGSSYVSDFEAEPIAPVVEKAAEPVAEPTADYEKARAEFEASPRRRRKTRGNSRSDHAPKPEDFAPVVEEVAETPVKTPARKAPRRNRPSELSSGAPSSAPSTRNRRRAVRRQLVEAPETVVEIAPEAAPEQVAEPQVEFDQPDNRRKRRRAVRVTAAPVEKKVASTSNARAPKKEPQAASTTNPGRRRRATRRGPRS
ncbi:translation initiation factor IF-2 N-terminal domain-containing protein [Corynebacterium glutamicum]|uniref:translation initiation factor IF-2 N-terminal domain-containing protein n=1 Tax=Corynebacterium glutamicum TaxID=1718 RepID=UPI001C6E1456|nr:translation initiation factor IF-2 N-terminal domain-containing protein [Corynebacterium glutamicum]QYR16917.1 translation initiation factor IF-2 N-terminal domain-containing protein [Corynebacterium glutamicum]